MKPSGQAMVHPSARCTRRLAGEGGSESRFQGDAARSAFGVVPSSIRPFSAGISLGTCLCPSLKVGGSSQHRPYAVDFIPPFLPLRSFCPFVSRHTHQQSDYASHGDKEPMARRNPPTDGFRFQLAGWESGETNVDVRSDQPFSSQHWYVSTTLGGDTSRTIDQ